MTEFFKNLLSDKKKLHEMMIEWFTLSDEDKSGYISLDELKAILKKLALQFDLKQASD